MGKYYNKTRGPLSATLRDGSVMVFKPKAWVTVADSLASSSSMVGHVRRGLLVRSPIPDLVPEAQKPEPKPKPEPAPEPVPEPEPEPKKAVATKKKSGSKKRS